MRSLDELASLMPKDNGETGMSTRQLHTRLKQWGIKKTAKGWPVRAVLARAHQELRDSVSGDGSLDDELKLRKITLLDIEIAERRGQLIPWAEHLGVIREIGAEVKAETMQWLQWVAAEIKTAPVYSKAQSIRDRMLEALAERIDEHGPEKPRSVAAGDKAGTAS